jgi:hypothetical protein
VNKLRLKFSDLIGQREKWSQFDQQISGYGRNVDRVSNGAIFSIINDLLGNGNRHVGLGFLGGGAKMWSANHPVQFK